MISIFRYLFKPKEAMRILALLIFTLSACQTLYKPSEEAGFSGDKAFSYLEEQMTFGPRFPGSPGHAAIQDWLVAELTGLGWVVERQTFLYKGAPLANIIATHPDPSLPATLLLGAHYDTRRVADRDADARQRPVPGANDGASGVAVLLELARVFAGREPNELMLVFFDGEDQGRLDGWDWAVGSQYFADNLQHELSDVVIVDMVGDRDLKLPFEVSSDPDLVTSIWGTGQELGFEEFIDEPGPSLIDDHVPFLQRGIPAIDIIDFTYPYWHTTADQLDKVSAESLLAVGKTLEQWLRDYDGTLHTNAQ